MLLKCLAAVLIIGGSTIYGFMLNSIYLQRIERLMVFRDTFSLICGYISYGNSGMVELFKSISRNTAYDYVKEFYNYMTVQLSKCDGRDMSQMWRQAVAMHCEGNILNSEDCRLLEEIGDIPLYLDGEAQIKYINGVILKLNTRIEQLQSNQEQKGRIYKSIGFAAGVFLVLVLI